MISTRSTTAAVTITVGELHLLAAAIDSMASDPRLVLECRPRTAELAAKLQLLLTVGGKRQIVIRPTEQRLA